MRRSLYATHGKRIVDVVASGSALTLGSPLIALVAVSVRWRLGRPVLFKQQRPGRDARLFTLYKFRTIREAHDAQGRPLTDEERLTRFGRFLRSTSLDELPELWNVLRGDMSLVGPRPLLAQYLELYSAGQTRRHEVRPGLTGWAQVTGRNAIPWPERFERDVWYVDNASLRLDVKILIRTVLRIFTRHGISQPGRATVDYFTGGKGNAA